MRPPRRGSRGSRSRGSYDLLLLDDHGDQLVAGTGLEVEGPHPRLADARPAVIRSTGPSSMRPILPPSSGRRPPGRRLRGAAARRTAEAAGVVHHQDRAAAPVDRDHGDRRRVHDDPLEVVQRHPRRCASTMRTMSPWEATATRPRGCSARSGRPRRRRAPAPRRSPRRRGTGTGRARLHDPPELGPAELADERRPSTLPYPSRSGRGRGSTRQPLGGRERLNGLAAALERARVDRRSSRTVRTRRRASRLLAAAIVECTPVSARTGRGRSGGQCARAGSGSRVAIARSLRGVGEGRRRAPGPAGEPRTSSPRRQLAPHRRPCRRGSPRRASRSTVRAPCRRSRGSARGPPGRTARRSRARSRCGMPDAGVGDASSTTPRPRAETERRPGRRDGV